MVNQYVQYGCGLSAPKDWINFDVSPTLRIQKIPIIGAVLKNQFNITFPSNVRYGDIIKGLPVADNSCRGIYCSHTLEHLSLQDFRIALKNTYRILGEEGTFRLVIPDLASAAKDYLRSFEKGDPGASINFMKSTLLGVEERYRGIKGMVITGFGNSYHLWMWDIHSISAELKNAGFTHIRECKFNDSEDKMFTYVEDITRFENAVAIECKK